MTISGGRFFGGGSRHRDGCASLGTWFILGLAAVAALSHLDAVLVLALLAAATALAACLTHILWNALCRKRNKTPNRCRRGVAKTAAAYAAWIACFALWFRIQDLTWAEASSGTGFFYLFIVPGIVAFICAMRCVLRGGPEDGENPPEDPAPESRDTEDVSHDDTSRP